MRRLGWLAALALAACSQQMDPAAERVARAAVFTPPVADDIPAILRGDGPYIPDFSYAGYRNGDGPLPAPSGTVFDVGDYGAVADDGLDDTKAVEAALEAARAADGTVTVRFPEGRFILSDILYLNRSDLFFTGSNTGRTTLYFPFPLSALPTPPAFAELDEYLLEFDKRQREKDNNVDMPFSLYAWSGGYIWAQPDGHRGKAYLEKYDDFPEPLTAITGGARDSVDVTVADANGLSVGDVLRVEFYNRRGENGPILDAIYGDRSRFRKLGGHHWNFPARALVTQTARVEAVDGNSVRLSTPLMLDPDPAYEPALVPWDLHLENVHIMNFDIEFPNGIRMPHHVEDGFNAVYLMGLYDSSVRNLTVTNADSAIITDDLGNITIEDITTTGEHRAHYTVHMGSVNNVLAQRITVENDAEHPLSFNTYAVRSVYRDSDVTGRALLDQHSGANHQNLFDDIRVTLRLGDEQDRVALFDGGGAGYWKPSHGRYSTFHNIAVEVEGAEAVDGPITLSGPQDGVEVRMLHVHGNRELAVDYAPDPYFEGLNQRPAFPSLYDWQRAQRGAD